MATASTPSAARSKGQVTKLDRLFEDILEKVRAEAPRDKEGAQQLLIHGGDFKAHVVQGLRRFSVKEPDYEMTRTILGKDFITPEEVMAARKSVSYSDEQIATLGRTLPSREELEWLRDHDYGLMPAPPVPLSLLAIRELNTQYFYVKEGGWYSHEGQKFSRSDKTSIGWLAARKSVLHNSTRKSWDEQIVLVRNEERVPNAAEMAWFLTTYFAVRGVYLFGNIYARTCSVVARDCRVHLGHFDSGGLVVASVWQGHRYSDLGLSRARKF